MRSVTALLLLCAPLAVVSGLVSCGGDASQPGDASTPAAVKAVQVLILSGNEQEATVGTSVLLPPSVIVRDAQGNPIAGIAVHFAVTAGGGNVFRSQQTTGADGVASVGEWTLGAAPGLNRLAVQIAEIPDFVFVATGRAAVLTVPSLQRQVLMAGLLAPWDFAVLPDGAILFTERFRGLSVRRSDGSTKQLFSPLDLVSEGQSGMNGLAIDPDFGTNRTIYVYMASTLKGTKDNRVIRLVVDPGYGSVSDRTDIVTGITYKSVPAPGAPPEAGSHNGGRMRFGLDGYLYITTGDTHHPLVPQSGVHLGGKVLRVDRNGTAAPNNSAPPGFDPRIYSFGLRNPQGIAFRPGTRQPFISEHGPNHSDEVTSLIAGGNGGWDPVCLDGASYCGYGSNQVNGSLTPMTDANKFPSSLRPVWNNGGRSQGMGASEFLRGPRWQAWDGALAVSIMNGKPSRIDILNLDAAGSVSSNSSIFESLDTRIRALNLGPDGDLYVVTDSKPGGDEIWRITPR